MIKESELKERCSDKFIEWLVNLADGFEYVGANNPQEGAIYFHNIMLEWESDILFLRLTKDYFPLLIHRAVEGWNNGDRFFGNIEIHCKYVKMWDSPIASKLREYETKSYQSENLTVLECALLDCMLEIHDIQVTK